MKIIISSSPAPFQLAFLLTGSVEHDEGCWMFLQEAVKGLIGQVEDRGVCLWPRHLGGLWLRGLRAETGRGDSKGNIGEEHCSWCVICMEQKSNTAVVHIPPDMSDTHIHTHTHLDRSSLALLTEHSAAMPRTSGHRYKQVHTPCKAKGVGLFKMTSLVTLLQH